MTATERAWGNAVNPAAALDQRYRKEIAELWTRIHELESAQPKWISVGERLPEKGHGRVLATDGSNVAVVQHYGYSSWGAHRVSIDTKHLTHWQPLPEPPGEGE